MAETKLPVEVQDDFLDRQTKASPIRALSELIWNALDGDANNVAIELVREDLAGGLSRIVVHDDGIGFNHTNALDYFKNLGGSWKRTTRLTEKHQRQVHGQEGRGRYKALALGRAATWKVCYDEGDNRWAFEISMLENDIKNVTVSEPIPAPNQPTGVIVEIEDVRRNFQSLSSDEGIQELTEIFALYLINYRSASIQIDGQKLDPENAISEEREFELTEIEDSSGLKHKVILQIVEWRRATTRNLYLCTQEGFPVDQVETRFHVGSFAFSAYLKSSYVSELHNAGILGLAEMDEKLRDAIEQSRQTIKDIYREKAAEQAKSVVEEWKEEKIYPYQGTAKSPIEAAERQVFDIVAVNLQSYSHDLEKAPTKSRALHLRMLRHAIERSPEELQLILSEVIQLPKRKQQELAELLQETSLSAIITAAKTVADRLKFLTGLEMIVFNPEQRNRLKERSQLHKILQENTWIFGEEYNLWVSDRDLRRVLEKHKKHLDPDVLIDEPVKVVGQKRGIIDLMFSRQVRKHRANDIENLVVELKAPRVPLGSEEIVQIKKYATAVANDERFHTVKGVKWHFWLISNGYDEYVENDIEGGPDPARRLIHEDGKRNIKIGIKTWAELIEENRARLQFFQENLEHNADESTALKHLRDRYERFLSGVIVEETSEGANEQEEHEAG